MEISRYNPKDYTKILRSVWSRGWGKKLIKQTYLRNSSQVHKIITDAFLKKFSDILYFLTLDLKRKVRIFALITTKKKTAVSN